MSRLFTGRKKTPWPNHTVVLRSVIVAGLLCIATSTVPAQQVETIKSTQPITCDSKSYELRLITAEARINEIAARALGIVLSPQDGSESKVFGIYWLNASQPIPTHRDNTNGTLGSKLIAYDRGTVGKDVPVVNSFFAGAGCLPTNSQVTGIQRVIETQSLLDTLGSAPITLKVIVEKLNNQGVNSLNADQIQTAGAGSLEAFKNLKTEVAFARAVRQFRSGLLGTAGRNNGTVGGKPTLEEENRTLQQTIDRLKNQVQQLETKKPSYLTSPLWLIVVFPITALLSLGGIALLGLASYHVIRKRNSNGNNVTLPPLVSGDPPPLSPGIDSEQKSSETEKVEELPVVNATPPVETTPPVEGFSEILKPLASNVDELKKSVDSIDARLKEHALIQSLLEHVYTNEDIAGQREKLVSDVQASMDQLDEISKTHFSTQLNGKAPLSEIIQNVKTRLDNDSASVTEFSSIQESVREYLGNDSKISEAVSKLIEEQSKAQEKLQPYHPEKTFSEVIEAVVSNYEEVTRQVRGALPNQNPTDTEPTDKEKEIKDLVTSLAGEYLRVKPNADRAQELETEKGELKELLESANSEVEAGKQLVDEISAQLNFNSEHLGNADHPVTTILDRLKEERASSVHLQLRTGLSSALIALDKAIKASEEDKEVVDALYLDKIQHGIQVLLTTMEDCSGEQLWHQALSEGFRENWLHNLIRAELLLRTYYADRRKFNFLRTAVSLACSSILIALHELQVEVVEVRLLEERPREMEVESVYDGIRNLPTVRESVRAKLSNTETKEMVVDVISFPYFVKGVQENRGCAAIANPSAWVQR